jgi:hypothetical protein
MFDIPHPDEHSQPANANLKIMSIHWMLVYVQRANAGCIAGHARCLGEAESRCLVFGGTGTLWRCGVCVATCNLQPVRASPSPSRAWVDCGLCLCPVGNRQSAGGRTHWYYLVFCTLLPPPAWLSASRSCASVGILQCVSLHQKSVSCTWPLSCPFVSCLSMMPPPPFARGDLG